MAHKLLQDCVCNTKAQHRPRGWLDLSNQVRRWQAMKGCTRRIERANQIIKRIQSALTVLSC